MTFAGLNYLAIVAAAVVAWVIGAAYYMTLSKPWIEAQGRDPDEFKREGASRGPAVLPFALSFIAELVMAWVLAGLLGHLGPGEVTVRNGVISAAFVWLGFVATTIGVNNMFGMKRTKLSLIDGGHWLLVLLAMGAVIGAFGV